MKLLDVLILAAVAAAVFFAARCAWRHKDKPCGSCGSCRACDGWRGDGKPDCPKREPDK